MYKLTIYTPNGDIKSDKDTVFAFNGHLAIISENGTVWKINVNNEGELSTTKISDVSSMPTVFINS